MEALKEWSGLVAGLIAVMTAIYSFVTARSTLNSKQIERLTERMEMQERKQALLEQELQHLPGKDDISRLELKISELSGSMKGLTTEIKSISRATDNINEILNRTST